MLTPQEVSSHSFQKAVMGGYNMAMVDEFLDEVTDDYSALYKENAALKNKMKVLVDKIEEYRSIEDSMRATLLTAQKMADTIVHEAEAKRDELMAQAEAEARARIGTLKEQADVEEARLRQGQLLLAQFVNTSRAACLQQIELLEQLPALKTEVRQEEPQAVPIEEIEEKVMSAFTEATDPAPAVAAAPEEAAPAAAEEPAPGEELGDTRQIDFGELNDLRFGRNYGLK